MRRQLGSTACRISHVTLQFQAYTISESVLCDEGRRRMSVLFEDMTSSRLPAVGASLGALGHRTTLMEK